MTETLSRRRGSSGQLTALLGGMFLGNVDVAIVNVAAPSVRDDLAASGAELELIVSGYALSFAVLLITSARLGEMRGYRRIFLLGLAVFTLASLGCGLAPTPFLLVCARIVQGAGAALMTSQVLTGIQLNFRDDERTRALGFYAVTLAGSAVIGQVLGGLLVSADLFGTGWRPVFLINVPIGAALFVTAWFFLPADQGRSTERLDLAGAAVLAAALALFIGPMILGREMGWPMWMQLCLAASPPAFALFVVVERRAARPLVELGLLRRAPVAWAMVAQTTVRATYFALLFVLALHLQQGLGESATYSGLVLVSWVAAFGVSGPLLGRMPARLRRSAAPAGNLLLAAAFAGIGSGRWWAATANGPVLIVLLGLGGLGYGAAFSATLDHLTSVVETRHAPDVSGLFNTTLQIGGAVGVAAFGAIYLDLAPASGPEAVTAFSTVAFALAAAALAAAACAQLAIRTTNPRQPPET
ncbi:MFS transporter [Saccharopolyspora sp. NPDC050642]|uniref:MFS transporter n=1 Tax=Saccharopolyspora sp. NPDC050642 TaxID=3157099 RepID=UPI0033D5F298